MTLDVSASSDLDLLYSDCGASATYRHGGAHSVDAASLTETASFSEESVTVVEQAVTRREAEASGGRLVEGDRLLHVRVAELTGDPAADDEIVLASDTWQVASWTKDASGLEWRIGCRRRN